MAESYLRRAIQYLQPTHPTSVREDCEALLAQVRHAKEAAAPDTLPFPFPGDEGPASAPQRESVDDPVTRATWGLVWATWALVVAGVVYAAFTLGILREQKKISVAVGEWAVLDLPQAWGEYRRDLNYGQGAALGVDAVVRFEPHTTLRYEFRTTGIASGEDYPVLLESGEVPPLQRDNLTKYTHLHLVGVCVDVAQGRHAIDIRVLLAEGTSYPSLRIIREMLVEQGVFPPPEKG